MKGNGGGLPWYALPSCPLDAREFSGGASGHESPTLLFPSCLKGYVNHSLSVFYTKDFQDHSRMEGQENVTTCRFGTSYSPINAL